MNESELMIHMFDKLLINQALITSSLINALVNYEILWSTELFYEMSHNLLWIIHYRFSRRKEGVYMACDEPLTFAFTLLHR